MIKELLFSGKKWFNLSSLDSDQITYNGRKYRSYPSRVSFWNDDAIKLTGSDTSSNKGLFKVEDECLGVFDNGITYYIVGNINRLYLIDKSKTLKVVWGGGKTLLSHLNQWFRRAFTSRNEVRACL